MSTKVPAAAAKGPVSSVDNTIAKLTEATAMQWIEEFKSLAFHEFGYLAHLFLTRGEQYVPPAVPQEAYNIEGASNALVAKLREQFELLRIKDIVGLRANWPKLFGLMERWISSDSWNLIRNHADFPAAELAADPHQLFKIILSTHLTEKQGPGDDAKILENERIELAFIALAQFKTQSVSDFKVVFDRQLLVRKAAGLPDLEAKTQVLKFILKLDSRFAQLQTDISNEVARGGKFRTHFLLPTP